MLEGEECRLERLIVPSARRPLEQEREHHGLRELGCAAEATVNLVQMTEESAGRADQLRFGEFASARSFLARAPDVGALEQPTNPVGRAAYLLPPFVPRPAHRLENLAEGRHPVARLGREIRAPVERRTVRRQEDREGPAPAPSQRLHRTHVQRIDIGPLLSVHLHTHEPFVHQPSRGRIVEGLPFHDVAPVARRVAYGEQDGAILCSGPSESFGSPRVPVDRIVRMLPEIGARLEGEPVRARGFRMWRRRSHG